MEEFLFEIMGENDVNMYQQQQSLMLSRMDKETWLRARSGY